MFSLKIFKGNQPKSFEELLVTNQYSLSVSRTKISDNLSANCLVWSLERAEDREKVHNFQSLNHSEPFHTWPTVNLKIRLLVIDIIIEINKTR